MKLIQASFSKRVLMVGLLACSSILVASSFAMSTGEPTRKVGWEVRHGHNTQAEWVGQRNEHMSDLKDKLKLNPQQEATWNSFARASKAGMYSMGGDRKATRGEFEKLKTDNSTLQNQLTEKDEQIKAKVAEIQKLILLGGPAQIARAKAELAKLKEMNDVYTVQIDSINKINAHLLAMNDSLNTNLSQERSKNDNLAQ